jgi:hypothetical protein
MGADMEGPVDRKTTICAPQEHAGLQARAPHDDAHQRIQQLPRRGQLPGLSRRIAAWVFKSWPGFGNSRSPGSTRPASALCGSIGPFSGLPLQLCVIGHSFQRGGAFLLCMASPMHPQCFGWGTDSSDEAARAIKPMLEATHGITTTYKAILAQVAGGVVQGVRAGPRGGACV